MNFRSGTFWVFTLGACVLLGVLAWSTATTLRLERSEALARVEATRQEALRLALWRMDSTLAPLIARESARPYFHYQPFYAAQSAYTNMLNAVKPGDVLVPSPLLNNDTPFVTLNFQRMEEGAGKALRYKLTSPQVPSGNLRDLAESKQGFNAPVEQSEARLEKLDELFRNIDADRFYFSTLPSLTTTSLDAQPSPELRPGQTGEVGAPRSLRAQVQQELQQQSQAVNDPAMDYAIRQQVTQNAYSGLQQNRAPQQAGKPEAPTDNEAARKSSTDEKDRAAPEAAKTGEPGTGGNAPGRPGAPLADGVDKLADKRKDAEIKLKQDAGADSSTTRGLTTPTGERVGEGGGGTGGPSDKENASAPTTKKSETRDEAGAALSKSPVAAPAATPAGISATPAPPAPVTPSASSAGADPTSSVATSLSTTAAPSPSPPAPAISGASVDALGVNGTHFDQSKLYAGYIDNSTAWKDARGDSTVTTRIEQGEFQPVWLGDAANRELVFVRWVTIDARRVLQGFWVDWPALRTSLLDSVKDLLPTAALQPINDHTPPPNPGQTLAAIPAELVAPAIAPAAVAIPTWTPARTTLLLTWITVLAAIAVAGWMLHSASELAERRGRFVSAVTHELRTPLTTFCLYSQMLADGMVDGDEARKEYLGTLKSESSRLAGIVENVLLYARLSRPRHAPRNSNGHAGHTTVDAVLERILPALTRRAVEGGMSLELERNLASGEPLHADPQTVERILLNLVDNACKYAGGTPDHRLILRAARSGNSVLFTVADHGPGIAPAEASQIFEPFYRAPHHEGTTTPGLGLGLALARGLARQAGGDLALDRSPGLGAAFTLTLPAT
ncbi:MAG: sensor histidine kinase [Phycisphaerales bacterium]